MTMRHHNTLLMSGENNVIAAQSAAQCRAMVLWLVGCVIRCVIATMTTMRLTGVACMVLVLMRAVVLVKYNRY